MVHPGPFSCLVLHACRVCMWELGALRIRSSSAIPLSAPHDLLMLCLLSHHVIIPSLFSFSHSMSVVYLSVSLHSSFLSPTTQHPSPTAHLSFPTAEFTKHDKPQTHQDHSHSFPFSSQCMYLTTSSLHHHINASPHTSSLPHCPSLVSYCEAH